MAFSEHTYVEVHYDGNWYTAATCEDANTCSHLVGSEDQPEMPFCSAEGTVSIRAAAWDDILGTTTKSYPGNPIYTVDWDADEADCICYMGPDHWVVYQSGVDTGNCCGDDFAEYYCGPGYTGCSAGEVVDGDGRNLIKNPGFEDDFDHWEHKSYDDTGADESQNYETIVNSGCYSEKCVKMETENRGRQEVTSAPIFLNPGSTYTIKVRYNTTLEHSVWVTLKDFDWKDISGDIVGRTYSWQEPGKNQWQTLTKVMTVPLVDAFGDPTASHEWRFLLHGNSPSGEDSPIYYDSIEIIGSSVCECGEPGIQDVCDVEGETGCWLNISGACCGDDMLDNSCNGEIGSSIGACDQGSYFIEPDYSQIVCDCMVGQDRWNIDGEAADSAECCGDDVDEYNKSVVCQTNSSQCEASAGADCAASCIPDSSLSNHACCNHPLDCVADDVCYRDVFCNDISCPEPPGPNNPPPTVPPHETYTNSTYSFDGKRHICLNGQWTDPDEDPLYCEALFGDDLSHFNADYNSDTRFWAKSGEYSGFGEYNRTFGIQECCGDDSGEHYNYYKNPDFDDQDDDACCSAAEDCVWNSTCYPAREEPYNISDEMRRCSDGSWSIPLELKYAWYEIPDTGCKERNTCGYCDNTNQQCYLPELGGCVDPGNWTLDHFCENGSWTSRTKLVALQLLDLVEKQGSEENYTLFCDSYQNTLNYFEYERHTTIEAKAWNFLEGYNNELDIFECDDNSVYTADQDKCVNKMCVLVYHQGTNKKVAFGTSLNQPINLLNDNRHFPFILLFPDMNLNDCDNAISKPQTGIYGNYSACNPAKAWYNRKTQSVIYSNQEIDLDEPNLWQKFLIWIRNPFKGIIDFIRNTLKPPQPHYDPQEDAWDFIKYTKDFNKIYLLKDGDKEIKGLMETNISRHEGKNTFFSVKYSHFDSDICSAVEAYNINLMNDRWGVGWDRESISCYASANNHYVQYMPAPPSPISGVQHNYLGFRTWLDLTARIRTHGLE